MSAKSTVAPASGRILELDALRGLAALAVVLFHFTVRYDELFGHTMSLAVTVPWGDFGVDLFFMLSGFVILMTLERTSNAAKFAWGRLSRLYPAYWAAGAVTFAVVVCCGLPGQEVTWREALVNLTMVQALLGAPHVDGAYWSLQAELIFYVNMLALFSLGCFRRTKTTVAVWVSVALAASFGMVWADGRAPLIAEGLSKLVTISSCKFIPLFGIGIVLYDARTRRESWRLSALTISYCLIATAALNGVVVALVDGLLASILLLAIAGRLPMLATRPLVFLGAISYTLYLVHQNVGYVIIRYLQQVGVSPSLAILAAVAVAMLLAIALHRWVERPTMSWLRTRQPTLGRRAGRLETASV